MRSVATIWAALLVGLVALSAAAQPMDLTTEVAKAEGLFHSGKDLLALGDYERACPLFAESFRLDPATGCLLALAMCREGQGKYASAYRAYAEVVSRSHAEGRVDREQAARGKVSELESKLSTLTLIPANTEEVDDLLVRINGEPLSPALLGTALPSDGGSIRVEVEQPGKEPWRAHLTIAPQGEARRLNLPPLRDSQPSVASAQPARVASTKLSRSGSASRPMDGGTRRASPGRRFAIGLLSVGGAGLATGLAFSLRATIRERQAGVDCSDARCSESADEARRESSTARDVAALSFVAGSGVAAAGLVTLLFSRRSVRATAVALYPWAEPRGAGAAMHVRY
jgi:hypothetical protein